jgi:hypothetical protein
MPGVMARMIATANVHPAYWLRQKLAADDLRRLTDACVIFEHQWLDDEGEKCWGYTVGGRLDGQVVGDHQGGATVGGELMIVHADSRGEADAIASLGLMDTINALDAEEGAHLDALAAKARLDAAGPLVRLAKATAAPADKSDEFERDAAAIQPLRGDDILLTVGGSE